MEAILMTHKEGYSIRSGGKSLTVKLDYLKMTYQIDCNSDCDEAFVLDGKNFAVDMLRLWKDQKEIDSRKGKIYEKGSI